MLKLAKSCTKPRQAGHPASSQPSHHLPDVQRGTDSAGRAAGRALEEKRKQWEGKTRDGTSILSYLTAVTGEKEELIPRGPLGIEVGPAGRVEGELSSLKQHWVVKKI